MSKGPGGRPSIYTVELGREICDKLANTSLSLKRICESDPRFPHVSQVYMWRLRHPEFHDAYTKARMNQADVRIDECEDIAQDCEVDLIRLNKAKLIIDTRKWVASKLFPKVYGNNDSKTITVNPHEKRLEQLED